MSEKKLTIGSDPEFILSRNGELYAASNILSRDSNSTLGTDGHPATGEIRAPARNSPIEHFEEIEKIVKQLKDIAKKNGCSVLAGSMQHNKSIGGHIHFNIKNPDKDLINILDLYLGIPLMLVEDDSQSLLRKRSYGQLSDYRIKPWGFEYRTPASWLVSRGFTKLSLCLAYAIVDHYQKHGKSMYDVNVYNTIINRIQFNKSNKVYYKSLMGYVYHHLKKLDLYKTYHKEINTLFSYIKSGKKWDSSICILDKWVFKNQIECSEHVNVKVAAKVLSSLSLKSKLYLYGVKDNTLYIKGIKLTQDEIEMLQPLCNISLSAKGTIAEKHNSSIGIPFELRKRINKNEYNELIAVLFKILKTKR